MGLIEKLMYSQKFMGFILFLLYLDIIYLVTGSDIYRVVIGTIIGVILLGYLAYYAHLHRSIREVLTLLTFTALTMILGGFTGLIIVGFNNFFTGAYVLTLTVGLLTLLYTATRLVKM